MSCSGSHLWQHDGCAVLVYALQSLCIGGAASATEFLPPVPSPVPSTGGTYALLSPQIRPPHVQSLWYFSMAAGRIVARLHIRSTVEAHQRHTRGTPETLHRHSEMVTESPGWRLLIDSTTARQPLKQLTAQQWGSAPVAHQGQRGTTEAA